jgi:hypothetical protein
MGFIESGTGLDVVPYVRHVRPVSKYHRIGVPNRRRIVAQFVSRTICQVLNKHCGLRQVKPSLLRCRAPTSQSVETERYTSNVEPQYETPAWVFTRRAYGKK